MKIILTLFTLISMLHISYGQNILSGEYSDGLKLAYDNKTNKLTGYFESYTGWDEEANNPKFSCIFYIEGVIKDNIFKIKTYFPNDKLDKINNGIFEIVNNKTIVIKFPEEHGGCWNVWHFADVNEPAKFDLEKNISWNQIRYVKAEKSYFYSYKNIYKRQKAYLIKNNFVCIEKFEGELAYCTFYGKKLTKGWLKTIDLSEF